MNDIQLHVATQSSAIAKIKSHYATLLAQEKARIVADKQARIQAASTAAIKDHMDRCTATIKHHMRVEIALMMMGLMMMQVAMSSFRRD